MTISLRCDAMRCVAMRCVVAFFFFFFFLRWWLLAVIAKLQEKYKGRFSFCVSHTSRKPRPGEEVLYGMPCARVAL